MAPNPGGTTRARRPRGEGQWALGYREPLNANERSKKDDPPLNVRERIENTYSRQGFDSIDPSDLRGRFRWYGLYTQRRPGIDGGRTATLEPEELDDRYFMMRVRIDGGALTTEQLALIGELSQTYARNTADITDRQNVQYHWIRIEDVPTIWARLEAAGLTTLEACGDSPRVILGSPVAGIAADEVLDATPAIEEIRRRYIGAPEFANLPRKFKTAISGLQDVVHEIHDVAFVGVEHPEHGPGLDLWVGGGLSTNPMLAVRLGAWVPLEEVPDVWAGVVGVFRDYGYRRLRSRARLKFLVKDWGPERFREVLETEYLGRPLIDGPAPEAPERPIDHVGVHRQRDGRYYVGAAPVAGRASGRCSPRWPRPPTCRFHPRALDAATEVDRARRSGVRGRQTANRTRRRWSGHRSTPWRRGVMLARASNSANSPLSRPRGGPNDSSRNWSDDWPISITISITRSAFTSTVVPIRARVYRPRTSVLRGRSSPTPKASRSRVSRSISAAVSGLIRDSAVNCEGTRSPPPNCRTMWSVLCATTSPNGSTVNGSPSGSLVPRKRI